MKSIKTLTLVFLIGIMNNCGSYDEENRSLMPAHSHNDYEQAQPLFYAIDCRFKSIEADVHLIGDSLFVSHNSKQIKSGLTLRRLYLEPLKKLVIQNNGSVYGNGEELILLIDLKSDGLKTYKQLDIILQDYRSILSVFESGKKKKGAVNIIVSGNRPLNFMRAQPSRLACFDGRISDIDKDIPVNLMPLVSDNWTKYFTWNGVGDFPVSEKEKLEYFIKKAKNKGFLLRFWQTPVTPVEHRNAVWTELVNFGVDLIGTDDIKGLHSFFQQNKKSRK
jgi:glycerophosphoryl diester phosphodiesterase